MSDPSDEPPKADEPAKEQVIPVKKTRVVETSTALTLVVPPQAGAAYFNFRRFLHQHGQRNEGNHPMDLAPSAHSLGDRDAAFEHQGQVGDGLCVMQRDSWYTDKAVTALTATAMYEAATGSSIWCNPFPACEDEEVLATGDPVLWSQVREVADAHFTVAGTNSKELASSPAKAQTRAWSTRSVRWRQGQVNV
jgi:hypothetical protein